MGKADLEELYGMVAVGDTVELVGERNDETARLFGPAPDMTPSAQPVLALQPAPVIAASADPASTPAAGQVLTLAALAGNR